MLVVTIEIWPFGQEQHKRTLGQAVIANDATGETDKGNYDFRLLTWHDKPQVWRKGRIENFPRLGRGPWDLLYRCLRVAVADRNKWPFDDKK